MSTQKLKRSTNMMTLDEIKKHLSDRNLSEVARRIGMKRQQLWMIATGQNKNPSARTIERISSYLEGGADGA
jgi:transcriptional regulator with XRE-family HTH domain